MRRLTAALIAAASLGAVLATPAQAATKTISGTILGSDRKAVDAFLGFDLKDSSGRALNADGSLRREAGYGITKRINQDLAASGSSDLSRWATTWSVTVPGNTARVYIEAYPFKAGQYGGTDETYYARSYRRNLAVPYGQRVNIRMPRTCGQGGTTGWINGYTSVGGVRTPMARIRAFSHAADNNLPNPILGWDIADVSSNGYYRIGPLPSGQPYQVWFTTKDGRSKRIYNVTVNACKGTYAGASF